MVRINSPYLFLCRKKWGDNVNWLNPIIKPGNSQVISDGWSLVELSFVPTREDVEYDLVIKGEDSSDKKVIIDDLLVYDASLDIYKFERKGNLVELFKNDHRIICSDCKKP